MREIPHPAAHGSRTEEAALKRSKVVAALVAACVTSCVVSPDTPMQSGEPFPIPIPWRLDNFGVSLVVNKFIGRGVGCDYTRQVFITSPVEGTVSLSGRLWVRWGSSLDDLHPLTREEYEALHLRCDLERPDPSGDHATPPFTSTCQTPNATSNWLEGCNWNVPLVQGTNLPFEIHCAVYGDGASHIFTVGVTEMRACTPLGCHSVEVEPALQYQGGTNITPRPENVHRAVITPP